MNPISKAKSSIMSLININSSIINSTKEKEKDRLIREVSQKINTANTETNQMITKIRKGEISAEHASKELTELFAATIKAVSELRYVKVTDLKTSEFVKNNLEILNNCIYTLDEARILAEKPDITKDFLKFRKHLRYSAQVTSGYDTVGTLRLHSIAEKVGIAKPSIWINEIFELNDWQRTATTLELIPPVKFKLGEATEELKLTVDVVKKYPQLVKEILKELDKGKQPEFELAKREEKYEEDKCRQLLYAIFEGKEEKVINYEYSNLANLLLFVHEIHCLELSETITNRFKKDFVTAYTLDSEIIEKSKVKELPATYLDACKSIATERGILPLHFAIEFIQSGRRDTHEFHRSVKMSDVLMYQLKLSNDEAQSFFDAALKGKNEANTFFLSKFSHLTAGVFQKFYCADFFPNKHVKVQGQDISYSEEAFKLVESQLDIETIAKLATPYAAMRFFSFIETGWLYYLQGFDATRFEFLMQFAFGMTSGIDLSQSPETLVDDISKERELLDQIDLPNKQELYQNLLRERLESYLDRFINNDLNNLDPLLHLVRQYYQPQSDNLPLWNQYVKTMFLIFPQENRNIFKYDIKNIILDERTFIFNSFKNLETLDSLAKMDKETFNKIVYDNLQLVV